MKARIEYTWVVGVRRADLIGNSIERGQLICQSMGENQMPNIEYRGCTYASSGTIDQEDTAVRHEKTINHQPTTRHLLYLPPSSDAGSSELHARTLI
jgi:hypothetical protein